MSVDVLHNFKVDDEWVVAIEVRNEATGNFAGSSLKPANARLIAMALLRQADNAEAGKAF